MKTLLITLAIVAAIAVAAAGVFGILVFAYWISGGKLWGLALACVVLAMPFAHIIARQIEQGL